MKKQILFIILLLLCIGCNIKQENKLELYINEIYSDSIYCLNFRNVDDIDGLISMIESSKKIEGEYIGFTAEKSEIYTCYKTLLELASDSLWIELSYSKSVVMRYYAYRALLSKGNVNLLSIRNRLIKDTTQVCYHSGCLTICNRTLGETILSIK